MSRLAEKLRKIESNPEYRSVWGSFTSHGYRYHGPNYISELADLEALLKEEESEAERRAGCPD